MDYVLLVLSIWICSHWHSYWKKEKKEVEVNVPLHSYNTELISVVRAILEWPLYLESVRLSSVSLVKSEALRPHEMVLTKLC